MHNRFTYDTNVSSGRMDDWAVLWPEKGNHSKPEV